MRKGITISILVLTLGATALPAFAGQSNGGRPILPGGEIVLGGQSNGGRPVIGGGGVFTTGQVDPMGGGDYQDPGFYSGGFYDGGGFLYPHSNYGFFSFMDWLFADLLYVFGGGWSH